MSWLRILTTLTLLSASKGADEYCSQLKPLETKHVTSTYEETRDVYGCVSKERDSKNGHQVIGVRVTTTSDEALLTLTDVTAKGVILVLDSSKALKWKLSFLGTNASDFESLVVILSPGSSLSESNHEADLQKNAYDEMQLSSQMSDKDFGSKIRQRFGGLTLFARSTGANRISLSLTTKRTVPSSMCNLDSLATITDFAVAFSVSKLKMQGCFNPEMIGTMTTDVHIIDLQNNLLSENLPVVFLSMTSEKSETTSRNITVVLKSIRPVRWYLESWHIEGSLKVISNNGPVEDHSLSAGQDLKIEKKALPDDFQQLWRTVISETQVAPISYIRVKGANVITIVVSPENVQEKQRASPVLTTSGQEMTSNYVPDRISLGDFKGSRGKTGFPKVETKTEVSSSSKDQQLQKQIQGLIGKKCEQSDTVITLPLEPLRRLNVTAITLNDQYCEARRNDTHWILETVSTSCGSLNSFKGKNPVMRNTIKLYFKAGSNVEQPLQVPFICKYPPGIGAGFEDYDDYEDDIEVNEEPNFSEMYTMEILRSQKQLHKPPEVLVTKTEDSAHVAVGDQLKVQTNFVTRSYISLAIERCWISDKPAEHQAMYDRNNYLIYEGCPADKNVTMFPQPLGKFPAFAFEVTEAHARKDAIYLYCIMGLCSTVKSMTSGNLAMCTDPISECRTNKWHIGSAAQQLVRRGPLYVTDNRPAGSSSLSNHDSSADLESTSSLGQVPKYESPSLHSAHVVMVGVPAEIAVAISVSSFLIGAALTGMLCCIHHRKALPKSAQTRVEETREGSELQSMLASPANSQQPSKMSLDVNV